MELGLSQLKNRIRATTATRYRKKSDHFMILGVGEDAKSKISYCLKKLGVFAQKSTKFFLLFKIP